MFDSFKIFFSKLFNTKSNVTTPLDDYIAAKQPSSPSELEYWVREFDRRDQRNML